MSFYPPVMNSQIRAAESDDRDSVLPKFTIVITFLSFLQFPAYLSVGSIKMDL